MKKKKLKKKELAVRIKRLVEQFTDLNNRLNRVSHDKLNQGLQLDELSDANAGLQQRLQEMQAQVEQLISQEEELSSLLESLQLQTSDEMAAEETSPEQQEIQRKLDNLNEQLANLHEQHRSFRHSLEKDSQSADILANSTDDLRRDVANLLSHIRRLEESGSELLVSDTKHEAQIERLQNDITDLSQKLEQIRGEWESPQQAVSRLMQESAQPLQQEIEQLRHQFSENGGQHKALEQRLLELANRIGETGARLERQQPAQEETRRKLEDLNEQLAALHQQQQSFRHSLEQDSRSTEILTNSTDDLRLDVADLLSHMRRLEESGSELLVSDSEHESQIQRLQNDIAELSSKLEQSPSERESPRQEIGRLLQESAQPLQRDIEHLKLQLSENGGQHKALEHRLLELANRIGETGARLERQQPAQEETQRKLDDLNEQLAILHEQSRSFRQTLEQDSRSADILANSTDDLRRDVDDLLAHIRRLEESGSELLVSDSKHESQIQRLQNDIGELSRKLEQGRSERENPQQEISRLLQEGTQPLQRDIEHLKHQLSESSGQHKGLDNRLLELANRIGETGARLESQQQDKARKNEVLEQRLSNLESLVQDLQPVSDADGSQLMALEQKLSQAEGEMAALLADKNQALATRIDSLDAALNEQAAMSASLNEQVIRFNSELAGSDRSLEERLASIDLRLSEHIDQQADLPDPLASITPVIEAQKEKFEETARQLKQEISGLSERLQTVDADENEAADWLSSLAANVDQETENRAQLQQALATTKSDINRRVDEIKARLIIIERQLKEQEEAAKDQGQKLAEVADEMIEQGEQAVALKLVTATLQEDSSQLKESNGKLNERFETLQRTLQEGEEKQGQITQQLALVEQAQKNLRELSGVGMDTLQERVKTTLAQLAEQSGLNEGLTQRLNDLEASLQAQFSDLENRQHQTLLSESESQERLTQQEQSNHTLSTEVTELKAEYQALLAQSGNQKRSLEEMTLEYGKRQEESEQVTQQLGLLGTQVASARSSGKYQGIAIGGLFVLVLLGALLGFQYFSSKLGGVERNLSVELMNISENYLSKNEIEQLMSVGAAQTEPSYDPQAVEALIEQQNGLAQRLDELAQQITTTRGATPDTAQDQAKEETPITLKEGVTKQQQPQQQKPPISSKEAVITDGWQALRERDGYSIQLIGVANEASIPLFVAKYGLQGALAHITTQRDGKAWHILLYGMYDSYAEANRALQRLPDALKSQQPWARQIPSQGTISGL